MSLFLRMSGPPIWPDDPSANGAVHLRRPVANYSPETNSKTLSAESGRDTDSGWRVRQHLRHQKFHLTSLQAWTSERQKETLAAPGNLKRNFRPS